MAQRYTTTKGSVVQPGAYPDIEVQNNEGGLATTGVVVLVGEADAGPSWSEETDLSLNFFGPEQLSEVQAKYKSGNLVEAFRNASNPANDVDIPGSPSRIYLVKTNSSGKASKALSRAGFSDYGVLADKSFGKLGNLIYGSVSAATTEVAPETGTFTYIPGPELGANDGAVLSVRVNGGAKADIAVAAQTSPTAFVSAVNAVSGLLAVGGVDRGVLTGLASGVTVSLAVAGNVATITLGSGTWTTTPSVGDTLIIPDAGTYGVTDASVLAGAGDQNLGCYVVTAATATAITARKLRDDVALTVTPPVAVTATAIGAEAADLLCFSPVNIKNVTGADRNVLTGLVGVSVTGTATANSLRLVLQTGSQWNALPQVGDYVNIPASAPAGIRGGSDVNVGWYSVSAATTGTAAGASTLTLTRLSNGAPVSFVATAIAASTDVRCLRPVVDGLAKAIEFYDGAGAINVIQLLFTTAGAPVQWMSTSGVPKLVTSTSQYSSRLNVNRQADGVQDEVVAGGDVVLRVGYAGTTATLTVGATQLTTNVTGGNGANLTIRIGDFKRMSDVAAYINSQTGYKASLGSALMGQLSPTVLDEGTYGIASELGSQPGQIKKDAFEFFKRLSEGTGLVQLGFVSAGAASTGLPEVQPVFYLAGGTKGSTSNADVQDAFNALARVRANFVVPLFSRDAVVDVEDGLTEIESSYEIEAVNAMLSAHVLEMSKLKKRRHRQGFASYRGSFAAARLAAQNIANYRVAMTCQDVRALSSDGIRQYQPWMAAVYAAAMQAAGFYKSIVFKGIRCSGALFADGSFSDQDDADLDSAIENGLLIMQRPENGPIRWSSDQTTYATDESFVFNSIQAIYAADVVALTVARRMEEAFVGQSVADVSAAVALSYLQGVMSEMKRLKLIAASDDAPLGYRNARITISGNVMKVEMEIKLAGAILFIPISFLVSQVQQSASL
ncbi:tail sheath protein [Myxococcus phage Mx1]|nr:tail sheath protein [Myxococcus phage Mx1]